MNENLANAMFQLEIAINHLTKILREESKELLMKPGEDEKWWKIHTAENLSTSMTATKLAIRQLIQDAEI